MAAGEEIHTDSDDEADNMRTTFTKFNMSGSQSPPKKAAKLG
jgi:hypothetical protein